MLNDQIWKRVKLRSTYLSVKLCSHHLKLFLSMGNEKYKLCQTLQTCELAYEVVIVAYLVDS